MKTSNKDKNKILKIGGHNNRKKIQNPIYWENTNVLPLRTHNKRKNYYGDKISCQTKNSP